MLTNHVAKNIKTLFQSLMNKSPLFSFIHLPIIQLNFQTWASYHKSGKEGDKTWLNFQKSHSQTKDWLSKISLHKIFTEKFILCLPFCSFPALYTCFLSLVFSITTYLPHKRNIIVLHLQSEGSFQHIDIQLSVGHQ